jgi:hypothetical protein
MLTTTRLATVCLTFGLLLSAADSYPPAQGPPQAPESGFREIPIMIFTNLISTMAPGELAEINATLAARSDVRATVSIETQPYLWGTFLRQTEHPDRPNDKYITAAHKLSLKVSNIEFKKFGIWFSYPFDRTIWVYVDVNTFCEGWRGETGRIKFVSRSPYPPYLEPASGGYLEAAVDFFLGGWLIDHVNAKIQQSLSAGIAGVQLTPDGPFWDCNSLSISPVGGWIRWGVLPTPLQPLMYVQLRKVKRLEARKLDIRNGTVSTLYQDIESPALDIWADIQNMHYQLPRMDENREVTLNETPVPIRQPANGASLVIIGSTDIDVSKEIRVKDSAFQVYSSSTGFGAGTQKLTVFKRYWMPPQPPFTTKPTEVKVAGYELTFYVSPPGTYPVQ